MSERESRTLVDKFMLRLPDGMRERLKTAAETNHRSMNAEILARLEISFNAFSPTEATTVSDPTEWDIDQWRNLAREVEGFIAALNKNKRSP